jgi:hypothetical protein
VNTQQYPLQKTPGNRGFGDISPHQHLFSSLWHLQDLEEQSE